MQKNISKIRIFLIAVAFLTTALVMNAREDATAGYERETRNAALDSILRHYDDWTTVELSGKLRASGLPMNPTVKLYMMRGSEIVLSVRAPFLGEVGRLEIINDSITAVYKLKKVYCRESLYNATRAYPGLISDIQSLLLGRMVVFGEGELSEANAGLLEFTEMAEPSGWSVSQPDLNRMLSGVSLEYVAASDGRLSGLLLDLTVGEKVSRFGISYSYPSLDGLSLLIAKSSAETWRDIASLDFNSVVWGAVAPAPVKISQSYRRVGIREFLKSF